MSDFFRILVTVLVASNPFLLAAAVSARPSQALLLQAGATGLAILVVVAAIAEPLLDSLSIEPESFRVAAGVIMLVAGAAAALPIGSPRRIPISNDGGDAVKFAVVPTIFPLAWPGIASAGAVAAAMSYGADSGIAVTTLAVVAAVAICGAAVSAISRTHRAWPLAAGRLCGGVLIVLAVDLIIAGVQDV